MDERSFDVVVLGGGPGGYVCAIRAAQLGLSTAVVEGEEVGGVCLNWGCIPSKALIGTAHQMDKARQVSVQGLRIPEVTLDPDVLQDWKGGVVRKLTGGIRGLLKNHGVTLVEGMGKLEGKDRLNVELKAGGVMGVVAKKALVIATGSSTIQVPGFEFDGERVIGAREAVNLRHIPRRMVVIGGGVIGLELGMAYQSFGTELTVVELTSTLLPGFDLEISRLVEKRLVARGGKVHKKTRAESLEKLASGEVLVHISTDGKSDVVSCDTVLVAVGMRPRSRDIGLETANVMVDERGFIKTDTFCRTNVPGVYAIGDVSGMPMLAHKASKEGEVCAEVIAGKPAKKDWVAIPGVVFTVPEIGSVGLTEEAARQGGHRVKVGKFPFAALGRAMCLQETEGFCKVVADETTGRVLGVHMVGPSTSDLIGEAILAMEMGATAEDLALTVHPHPTLTEALMEASAASLGHAIHIVNR